MLPGLVMPRRYFYIPARKEHRGIGGLFFDDLSSSEAGFDVEEFVRDVGNGILPSWLPIVARHRSEPFTDAQRQWQLLRRGRYIGEPCSSRAHIGRPSNGQVTEVLAGAWKREF